MTALPRFTRHAEERWAYRCEGMDRDEQWARARRISPKRLARLCHHSGRAVNRRTPVAAYWLTPQGLIFVVADHVVLTVYRVRMPGQ